MRALHSNYFYGNEVSDYGKEHGYVDYRTLSRAFDAVLNNDIIEKTSEIGYWTPYCGSDAYYEDAQGRRYTHSEAVKRYEELEDELGRLNEGDKRADEINDDLCSLEHEHYDEVFQWFIVSESGAKILEEWTDEIVYYNSELDMYVWGVTHWGTAWDYVLTNIKIEKEQINQGGLQWDITVM